MHGPPDPRDQTSSTNYLIARRAVDQARQCFPWYDAVWLRAYVAARELISHIEPARLAEFIDRLEPLRTRPDFSVVELDSVFDAGTLEIIRRTASAIPTASFETHEISRMGRTVVHDHPLYSNIHRRISPRVSELVGEPVEASYNFLSLYSDAGVCEPHLDSPEAKWTLDVCIDQSTSWPLHLSQVIPWPEKGPPVGDGWDLRIRADSDLRFTPHELAPGRGLIFSGSSQWHYRDAAPDATVDDYWHLLFFHFVPAGTRDLARPKKWAEVFSMPELDWVAAGAYGSA
jgi:hypothetical protein